jgi:hypothetical protein
MTFDSAVQIIRNVVEGTNKGGIMDDKVHLYHKIRTPNNFGSILLENLKQVSISSGLANPPRLTRSLSSKKERMNKYMNKEKNWNLHFQDRPVDLITL